MRVKGPVSMSNRYTAPAPRAALADGFMGPPAYSMDHQPLELFPRGVIKTALFDGMRFQGHAARCRVTSMSGALAGRWTGAEDLPYALAEAFPLLRSHGSPPPTLSDASSEIRVPVTVEPES